MRAGWAVWAIAAAGCYVAPGPAPRPMPPRVVATPAPPPAELPPVVAPLAADLYPLDDAIADALSGPWTLIGTGPWFGNHRIHACAYRNARVIVVNVYCTLKEQPAFRIDVFSPTKGRARIYAEASAPISTLRRAAFFSFKGESEPLDTPGAELPPVHLGFSYADLVAYEERRYKTYAPACYGGVEVGRPQGGCLRQLAPRKPDWTARNAAFLDNPPEDFYLIVRALRVLAEEHGQRPRRKAARRPPPPPALAGDGS